MSLTRSLPLKFSFSVKLACAPACELESEVCAATSNDAFAAGAMVSPPMAVVAIMIAAIFSARTGCVSLFPLALIVRSMGERPDSPGF